MLIGIDETGTVVDGETVVVVAVLVQPSRIGAATRSLTRWEDLTRRRLSGSPTEVKSTSLDERGRREFVNKVLWPGANGVCFFAVAAQVDERVLAWGAAQRDRTVDGLRSVEADARGRGLVRYANSIRNLTGFHRNVTPGMSIKLHLLGIVAAKAINRAIVTSALGGFDNELGQLRCSIDHGFTRGGIERWRYVLRNHLMQSSQTDPPVLIDTWGPDHPFISTFVHEQRGDYLALKPEFGKRFDFCDSRDVVEVRLADLVAGLVRSAVIYSRREPWEQRAWERSVDTIDWLDFTHTEDFNVETRLANLYQVWAELDDPLAD